MKLILLVGPPGSGKSTFAKSLLSKNMWASVPISYVNQDSQGKLEHFDLFNESIKAEANIIVDRMNFSKAQRSRYLEVAKMAGYETEIHVFHESIATCIQRCFARENHETVKTPEDAKKAITFFFKNYERVDDNEADTVIRHWPEGDKPEAIICDLDGTMCNVEHRRHWVSGEKKNWAMWNAGIKNDTLNKWCMTITNQLYHAGYKVVLCSGRVQEYKLVTIEWLLNNKVLHDNLFMRQFNDSRPDNVIKEIILDFEILTRYKPIFMIDDRRRVVDMYRGRGYTVLQCAKGDF